MMGDERETFIRKIAQHLHNSAPGVQTLASASMADQHNYRERAISLHPLVISLVAEWLASSGHEYALQGWCEDMGVCEWCYHEHDSALTCIQAARKARKSPSHGREIGR